MLAHEYPGVPLSLTERLSPGQSLPSLIEELAVTPHKSPLALVGHEPDLSNLIALLLCGEGQATVQLKKGGAALLDFPLTTTAGDGELLWLLTAGQLRKLGILNR